MGNFLDSPVESMEGSYGEFELGQNKLQYALTSMQGWRVDMEDAHVIIPSLALALKHIQLTQSQSQTSQENNNSQENKLLIEIDTKVNYEVLNNLALFAVLDGHGGKHTSNFSSRHIVAALANTKAFEEVVKLEASPHTASYTSVENSQKVSNLLGESLRQCYEKLDDLLSNNADLVTRASGTTAVAAFITKYHVVSANLGDSRLVLSSSLKEYMNNLSNGKEAKFEVQFGSEDHKPENSVEQERITKAGLTVFSNRICGDLALSRALGDFSYKQNSNLGCADQAVSIVPDVTILERARNQSGLLLLACDGVWDVLSNQQLLDFVAEKWKLGLSFREICAEVCRKCVSSMDNISIIIVALEELDFRPFDEYKYQLKIDKQAEEKDTASPTKATNANGTASYEQISKTTATAQTHS